MAYKSVAVSQAYITWRAIQQPLPFTDYVFRGIPIIFLKVCLNRSCVNVTIKCMKGCISCRHVNLRVTVDPCFCKMTGPGFFALQCVKWPSVLGWVICKWQHFCYRKKEISLSQHCICAGTFVAQKPEAGWRI